MEVAFHIGLFAIRWYGIMIALAAIAAVILSIIETKRRGEATYRPMDMRDCHCCLYHSDSL